MIKKSILLLSAAALIGGAAKAQTCATDEINAEYRKQHPEIAKYQEQLEQDFRKAVSHINLSSIAKIVSPYTPTSGKVYPTVYVPIVVHIVHDYGTEDISDAAVYDMVAKVNQIYSKKNTDLSDVIPEFQPYIGNPRIQFVLANKDPFGNPTTGITKRQSYLTTGGDDQAKFDIWAPERYLNIWMISSIGRGQTGGIVLAYSTFPSSAAAVPYTDGIIGRADATDFERTYPHEIGHYLNLFHPWNSSNKDPGTACGDDEVDDTPPTTGHFGNGTSLYPNGASSCNEHMNVLYDYDTACIGFKGPGIPDPNFDQLNRDSTLAFSKYFKYYTSANWDNLGATAIGMGDTTTKYTFGDTVTTVNSSFRIINGYASTVANRAIELTTQATTSPNGLIPGRTVNGTISKTSPYLPVAGSGFPFKHRPAQLVCYLKYAPAGTDQGYINVTLTKWDTATKTRGVVCNSTFQLQGSQAAWTRFSFNLDYTTGNVNDNPDTAQITFSASSANPAMWANGSYLDVDDVSLQNGNDGYFKTFNNGAGGIDTADYPDIANTQNIMDYSNCKHMFTHQQVDRMRSALLSPVGNRNKLISAENLYVTGIVDTTNMTVLPQPHVTPIPDFSVEKGSNPSGTFPTERSYFLCADGNMSFVFKDHTWRNLSGAGSVNLKWDATNGTVANGTSATASVKANNPGWLDISLSASNNYGDSVLTRHALVYAADPNNAVDPNTGGYYQEFAPDGDRDKWPMFNYYDNQFKWEIADNTGYYDTHCIVYKGFDTRTYPGLLTGAPAVHDPSTGALISKDYDDFFTTAFDLSNMGGDCNLNFMYSGASRTGDPSIMLDSLDIAYSTNCGATWTRLKALTKTELFNKGVFGGGAYAPLWLGDWALASIPVSTRASKVYFRFRYKPNSDVTKAEIGIGNNFYIDRINISPFPLGVNTLVDKDRNIALVPNPTSSNAYVVISDAQNTDANIVVTDITGKVVFRTNQTLHDKISRVEIPASSIAVKGIYMVQVVAGNKNYTDKLVAY